jgi:NAD(P)-dependent dehydrogenase (short-subunit alcohol dehydrogenase family)
MPHPFNSQVTLITGAAGGLGRQLALELSARGAVIAATDLHPEGLERLLGDLKARNGAGAWEIADVTDPAALGRAVAAFEKKLGPVEILVANAGIGIEMRILDFKAEDFARQVQVNLIGVANSVAAVLSGMLARGHGHLVAISSLASYRGLPLMAGYCASKAGVNSLMDALRLELPKGIACTTICPGWIRTPLTADLPLEIPKLDIMEVEDAARRIVHAMERRQPFYPFPWRVAWPVRLGQFLPTRLGDALTRLVLKRHRPRR